MHELAVTQALLELCLQRADAAEAARVSDLYIQVGELSSYVDEAVQFYWDIISEGTPAEGAKLHFERIAMRLECRDCGEQFEPDTDSFACPRCDSERVEVVAGDGLQLMAIDIEKEMVEV
jgi:hydrogenase nickel incorporation protein HypA/HybF